MNRKTPGAEIRLATARAEEVGKLLGCLLCGREFECGRVLAYLWRESRIQGVVCDECLLLDDDAVAAFLKRRLQGLRDFTRWGAAVRKVCRDSVTVSAEIEEDEIGAVASLANLHIRMPDARAVQQAWDKNWDAGWSDTGVWLRAWGRQMDYSAYIGEEAVIRCWSRFRRIQNS